MAIASLAPCADAWSLQNAVISWIKSSSLIADLHREHVSSGQVRHMMKSTPLVDAPDRDKMDFANGPIGRMVAGIMESEQSLLGDWKIEKIVEAASDDFDEGAGHRRLLDVLDGAPVTLFSFVDCPWCLLAKKLLSDECGLIHGDGTLQVIELEDLGWEGKRLRASVALATGRTSMPACFIDGKSVGGYTDGFMNGADSPGFSFSPAPERNLICRGSPGLAIMHERGDLAILLGDT